MKRTHHPTGSMSSTASEPRSHSRPRLEMSDFSKLDLPPSASGPSQGISSPNITLTLDELEALEAARRHPRIHGSPTDPGPEQHTFSDLFGILMNLDSPLGCDASTLRSYIWKCPDCTAEVSRRYARDHWRTSNCGGADL